MHGTFNSNSSTDLPKNKNTGAHTMDSSSNTISAMLSPKPENGTRQFDGTNFNMSLNLSEASLRELQAMDDLFGVLAETLMAFESQNRGGDFTREIADAMTAMRDHVWSMLEHYECADKGEVYERAISVIRSFAHCGAGLDEIIAYASHSQIGQREFRRRNA